MEQQNWGQYERLRPGQIESIRAKAPVAYLPWGALEYHSYHNPVGLDATVAHGLCCALAAQAGGLVLPPVYIAADTIKPFKGFPHSIDFPAEMVAALARQFLEQLVEEKFQAVVLLSGHMGGGHMEALNQVRAEFEAAHPGFPFCLITSYDLVQDQFPANHAARGETSLQLHFDPVPVDLARLPEDRAATLDDDGVWGDDPRAATAEQGALHLEAFLRAAVPKVRDLLARAR